MSVVSTVKFCYGYVSSFTGVISPDGGQLLVKVYDSPNDGVTTVPPATGSAQVFNFNNQFIFEGTVSSIVSYPATSGENKSYLFNLACSDIISNFSSTIASLDTYNINTTYVAERVLDPVGFNQSALLASGNNVYNQAYVYGAVPPDSNYGTTFDWRTYPGSDAFFLNDVLYRSYIRYPENAPNGSPLYMIDGAILSLVKTIQISTPSQNPSATNNPNAQTSSSTATTTSTTSSQINTYGMGTTVTVSSNDGTVPTGTTVRASTVSGVTTTTTVYATLSQVTTTVETSFSPSRNTTSRNIQQKQEAFNQPQSFNGSIDPTLLYPSIQIYPSSNYYSKESGKFFGRSASPTSFDLDPYFYFTTNDYGLVAKDGRVNSTNINVRKDGIKDHVRTMGLKGPIYYSGWGYDSRGLPVPNASDTVIQTGVNSKGEPLYGADPRGSYKFNQKTSVERKLWKTGPVDLRWHDKRKVWVGGQEMLEGYLLDNLNAPSSISGVTTARMSVFRIAASGGPLKGESMLISPASGLYNQNGVQTGVVPAKYGPEFITISNRDPSLSASSGAYCMAVDINYEWRPIYIGC